MKLKWLGHGSFLLTESTGTKIVLDPYSELLSGYKMAEVFADAVTVSTDYHLHNNISALNSDATLLDKSGSFDFKGIHVTAVQTKGAKLLSQNDKANKDNNFDIDPDGFLKNTAYKFRLDGVTVCHLGSITEYPSPELIEQLIPVNVLLVPIAGGKYSISPKLAKDYVDAIMPDIVIPMQFKTKHSTLDIEKLDAFLRLFDDDDIIPLEKSTIELDRNDFAYKNMKILIPKRFKG